MTNYVEIQDNNYPDTCFSDPIEVSSSDVESFDEDDMYGSDHCMDVVSESSDRGEQADDIQPHEELMVLCYTFYFLAQF